MCLPTNVNLNVCYLTLLLFVKRKLFHAQNFKQSSLHFILHSGWNSGNDNFLLVKLAMHTLRIHLCFSKEIQNYRLQEKFKLAILR